MKTMKKIVAIVAVALMLCSILPLSVFAADDVTINTYATTGTLSGTASISWESGDYQVVSYKNTSTTAIRTSDADHFRYYVGNKVVISGKDGALMSKVVITCTGSSYMLNNASNTLGDGWTVKASGTTLTYTPDGGSASELTITIGKQSRSSKIVITPAATEPEVPSTCEHENAEYDFDCVAGYCPDCEEELPAKADHSYEEEITLNPTCTEAGEKTLTCACGDVKTETVNALGHDFSESDNCAVCGEEKPLNATITFDADKTQRTEYTTTVQKWENDGLTLINNKASSTTNVGDYSNPGRFYKSSSITISFPAMTSLVINAPSGEYGTPWATTLTNAGYTYTNEGTVYTVTFAEPVDSITLTCSAQIRAYSITAYGTKKCEHEFDNSCDNECNNCGEANPDYADHVYAHEFDVDCDVCDAERAVVAPVIDVKLSISEDVNGLAFRFEADVAGFAIKAGTFVQADYTNATYKGYKLIETGVIATNGVTSTTIKGERMCDLDENGKAMFAYRIIDIPADKLDVEITMTPYYVVEIDGVATTIEGEAVVGSYTAVAG